MKNHQVEQAIAALRASGKDITADYASWRNIGFALAEGFGPQGREYFHQVSQMYPGYDAKACDQQYERCLKSSGSGITLATFFHYLREAGISISPDPAPTAAAADPSSGEKARPSSLKPFITDEEEELSLEDPEEEEELPGFSDELHQSLPLFLKKAIAPASSAHERDMVLVGALAVLSACFPNVFGYYDGKRVLSNLYVFITAKASSGKGILNLLKKLILPIHGEKREEAKRLKQEFEMAQENGGKEGEKTKPAEKMLLIPANSSATGIFQLLNDNDGRGLIFETEGDTLSQVFKSDYGNYSDGFRKAFHHETISYYRRTDREYVDIESPALSAMLTGTPGQVHSLIPGAENGLFSRFLFYHISIKPQWKDVFAAANGLNQWQHYSDLGKEFHEFWKAFQEQEMQFSFTSSQQQRFNRFFSRSQRRYFALFSDDYIATVRRLGLISFRIGMLLSVLRLMEDPLSIRIKDRKQLLICQETDFDTLLEMISVLIHHSSRVFRSLPLSEKPKTRLAPQENLLNALPSRFNRKSYLELAAALNIPAKSADRYVRQFLKAGEIGKKKYNDYVRLIDGSEEGGVRS